MIISYNSISNAQPLLTSDQLVQKMCDKGITFDRMSHDEASAYLACRNHYFRTASYKKNYEKHTSGKNKNKYIALDFAYLCELSTIDMHLRYLILKMCLDIEHSLKVQLLQSLEQDENEDGYNIVEEFITQNSWIIEDIYRKRKSPYVCDLIEKHFFFYEGHNTDGSSFLEKAETSCPVWALLELLTFKQFLDLYSFYHKKNCSEKYPDSLLNTIKSLRNACAHNNCLIHNLRTGGTKPSSTISKYIASIDTISKDNRKTKLSVRPVYEFVSLLYLYDKVVSLSIKKHRYRELKDLVDIRMIEHADYFENQQIISSSYIFIKKVVDNLIL